MRRGSRFSMFTAALAVAGAVAAPSASGWELPPTPLSPPAPNTSEPSVALDRDGNALAIWSSDSDDLLSGNVWGATAPSGGAWSGPGGMWTSDYAGPPALAAASDGDAVAAWFAQSSDGEYVQIADRDGGTGAWAAPDGFAPQDSLGTRPAVAIDEAGNAVVVWSEYDGGVGYVRAAWRTAGDWSDPVTISDTDDYSFTGGHRQLHVAFESPGHARALWTAQHVSGSTFHVQESRFDGSDWTAAQNLTSSADYIDGLALRGDGDGRLVAAWFLYSPFVLQAASSAGADWTIADVSDDVGFICSPPSDVSMGADGAATVAWTSATTGGLATSSGQAGTWGPATPVGAPAPATLAYEIALAQNAAHGPVAAWTTYDDENQIFTVMGSRRVASGWQAPTQLATAGWNYSRPSLAIDPSGRALAAWSLNVFGAGKVHATWSQPPDAPPTPKPGPTEPKALNPPFVRVRGGTVRMPRRGRTLRLRLVNRDRVSLTGSVRLARYAGRGEGKALRFRTIALRRGVRLRAKRGAVVRLRLSAAAVERLRESRRHSYPVRLYLRLRAPDGRTIRVTQTLTLDGWKRFGSGQRPPVARKAC
jgi:hypothetical protein